jgi:hypothetical protein
MEIMVMKKIIDKFGDKIKGVLSTFDRMIIKGHLREFFYDGGRNYFLSKEKILFKDFNKYAESKTNMIKSRAQELANNLDRPYLYLDSPKTNKENIALKQLKKKPIEEGLICILATVEYCISVDIFKNKDTQKLELKTKKRKCLYLYFYYLDKEFGFIHVKIQTWFPFQIQIYINGREYLAKQLDKENIKYERYDNCFTDIEDIKKAQEIARKIESKKYNDMFNHFAKIVNPFINRIVEVFGSGYFWCMDQCEYATDIMFKNRDDLDLIYPDLVDHALTSFKCEDVMTFLGRKMHHAFTGEVVSDLKKRPEGIRIKHRMKSNSIKMYNKFSVLRIETTINQPKEFKIYKEVTRKGKKVMKWVAMGKSIANLYRYAQVSEESNIRYLEAIAEFEIKNEHITILEKICDKVVKNNRIYTGFNPLSKKDTDIFLAVLDGNNYINNFTNSSIRKTLFPEINEDEKIKYRNKVTRILAKLKAFGLVIKIPHSFKYKVSKKGISIMSAALKLKRREFRCLYNE